RDHSLRCLQLEPLAVHVVLGRHYVVQIQGVGSRHSGREPEGISRIEELILRSRGIQHHTARHQQGGKAPQRKSAAGYAREETMMAARVSRDGRCVRCLGKTESMNHCCCRAWTRTHSMWLCCPSSTGRTSSSGTS